MAKRRRPPRPKKAKVKSKQVRAIRTKKKTAKRYNNVAQGKDNKCVRSSDARQTLAEINCGVGNATVEHDDPSLSVREQQNTPTWGDGVYEPGCEDGCDDAVASAPGKGRVQAILRCLSEHGPATLKHIRQALPARFTKRSGRNETGCPIYESLQNLVQQLDVAQDGQIYRLAGVAETFVAAFNEPDFIEGLDDLTGPSASDIREIEQEVA